jgi:hypothetical protein
MLVSVSQRGAIATAIAVAVLFISAAAGIRAETAPQELACRFVGVSGNETGRAYPTAIEAAATLAADLSGRDPELIGSNRGVIDVTGSATLEGEPIGERVFAIRNHGRSVGFLHVDRDAGGWGGPDGRTLLSRACMHPSASRGPLPARLRSRPSG